jgi:hypothetical protein
MFQTKARIVPSSLVVNPPSFPFPVLHVLKCYMLHKIVTKIFSSTEICSRYMNEGRLEIKGRLRIFITQVNPPASNM